MSANNPDITASDIIENVQNLLQRPDLDGNAFLPWISVGYNKTFAALIGVNQRAKEELFGAKADITLSGSVAEYSINANIPRFGGFVKIEIRYGASGDDWTVCSRLASLANWNNQNNVSTSYRAKNEPLFYKLGDLLGFIPTPSASDTAQTQLARVWYIKRPYQITDVDDVIDIPYRFLYPVYNYVQAKAIQAINEDYSSSTAIEARFDRELGEVVEMVEAEFDENDGTNEIQVPASSMLYGDPLRW